MGMAISKNEIYLGDCRDLIDSVPDLDKAILVTDPPFNIGYHYEGYEDKMGEDEYYSMLVGLINKCGGRAVIIHYPEALHELSIRLGKRPTRVCSWVYNSNTPRQHRDIAYYGITPVMKQMTQPFKNPTDRRIAERIERGIEGGALYDWFEANQIKNVSDEKYDHPCQMPIKVMLNAIGVLPKGECSLIVEPFCGTGTTCLAARELGWDYIGFDINEKYVGIAKERLMGTTPKEIKTGVRQLKLF